MLSSILEKAVRNAKAIRADIDERIAEERIRLIRDLWIGFIPKKESGDVCIAGIDSSYNYLEYRGYALYAANATWVGVCSCREEIGDQISDVGIISTTLIERELDLLTTHMELEAIEKAAKLYDLVLVDGSVLVRLNVLMKASRSHEKYAITQKYPEVNPDELRLRLLSILMRNEGKVVFIAKKSYARDILGLSKGDIYYFERYTYVPGFSHPILASEFSEVAGHGVRFLGFGPMILEVRKMLSSYGMEAAFDTIVTYVRFDYGSRVYRMEIPVFTIQSEDITEIVKRVIRRIVPICVQGYPYVLSRVDSLVRITNKDMERVAMVLGLYGEPTSREPVGGV